MTESEWQAATDPTPMLAFLQDRASNRKLLLFAAACCDFLSLSRGEPTRNWNTVDAVLDYADGQVSREAVAALWDGTHKEGRGTSPERPLEWIQGFVSDATDPAAWPYAEFAGSPSAADLTVLFREVFGNPFRPVCFAPEWRIPTVTALAQAAYNERDFDRLPILADALEDAGCIDRAILDHCRSTGPHVRGCWAVDLCLDLS